MIMHGIVLISIVLLLIIYLSLTHFSNNVFYAHQQALAVKVGPMKYFAANILDYSSNNTLVGGNKETKFFVYENPIYGIKLDYPFGWDKLEFDQSNPYGLVAGFVIPREGKPLSEINVSDFILENIMLGVKIIPSSFSSTYPKDTVLDRFVAEQISDYKQQFTDFHIIASNTTSINNNPTYQIQYTYKDRRATFDTLQIWTISGNKIYTILFNADPADYPTYLPILQKMADSFIILNSNNQNSKTG
jgi:eukaryotic-like serine/threonine-protein kinase